MRISDNSPVDWKDLEVKVALVLNQAGYHAQDGKVSGIGVQRFLSLFQSCFHRFFCSSLKISLLRNHSQFYKNLVKGDQHV